ncbi:12556_t:CDS:10, partial [Funneliformis caledonium]
LETYLNSTVPSSVSYLGFLKSARHIIVKTPPLTEDWKGLNGAWYRRFSKASKELNPPSVTEEAHFPNPSDNEEYLLTAIYLNPEYRHIFLVLIICDMDTRPYWQEIIEERKKAGTIRSKTIDAYQAVGENVGDEIVDECKQSSKRLEKDKQEQSRSRSGAEYHADSKDNVESQDPISVSEDDDLDIFDQEAIDQQGEVKEATNDKVKENKNGPFKLSETNRKEIEEVYKLMDKQFMWKLSSERIVEEELYKLGKDLEFEHAVHSFILDVDDKLIAEHFTEAELREMEDTPIPEVSELSDEIINLLNKFTGKTNLNEIRQIIKEVSFGSNYDREKHHDMDYICLALHALVREIESGKITDTNLENWFNCHVWSVIFDQAFGDMKTIAVVRGESTSVSTATRKNKKAKRKLGERRKIGRRGDWILRAVSNGNKDEFGAGEAGKCWLDEYETKYLREGGLKLPKTLKDMLLSLMERISWNSEIRKKIQTMGLFTEVLVINQYINSVIGLMLTVVYADNPKGYVCRYRRCDTLQVPDTVEKFDSILMILASVLNAKSVVQETVKVVQTAGQTTKAFKTKLCTKVNNTSPYPASPCPGTPNSESLIAE